MAYDPFGEDNPFKADEDYDPAMANIFPSIVLVQTPTRSTRTAVAVTPRGSAATDEIEQHALHSIFADGTASQVLWDGCVESNRDQMSSRTHKGIVWHEHRAFHTLGPPFLLLMTLTCSAVHI